VKKKLRLPLRFSPRLLPASPDSSNPMSRVSRVSNPAAATADAAAKNGKGASDPAGVFGIPGLVLGGGVV
jgi:hypothetical protein